MDCEAEIVEKKQKGKKHQSKFQEALLKQKPVFDPSIKSSSCTYLSLAK
jgi:hypothetical protein